MSTLSNLLARLIPPISRPEPDGQRLVRGVYHYLREEGMDKTRVHLRIEQDGHGLLLVNAARVFHLNPTAAHMAYLFLEQSSEPAAVRTLQHLYQVSRDQALSDYRACVTQIEALIQPDGGCPICDLELETTAPFSDRPSAPYRMDLALTYRCNNACAHCYNARSRQYPELDTAAWKEILDRLWEIGVPHIVFTGGEPTLRPDLPELIAHAERNGQITGINSNGRLLKNPDLVQRLADAGLDHVQITLESHLATIHDQMVRAQGAWQDTIAGIKNVLSQRLFVMTNTTLLRDNTTDLSATLQFLADLGVPTVGLNALIYSGRGASVGTGLAESALPPLLDMARAETTRHGQRLIWYTPTQYCHFDPIQVELGVKGCTAALYNMCIEPDGAVIPCQSYYQPVGNMLRDPWEQIWNHDLSTSLRERRNLPADCLSCSLVQECGGGCPLARQTGQSFDPVPVHPL